MKALLGVGISVALASTVQPLLARPLLSAWGQRLGWTLIHSAWQLTLTAVIAGLVCVALHRRSARVRYVVQVAFLSLMLIIPGITWAIVGTGPVVPSALPVETPALAEIVANPPGNSGLRQGSDQGTFDLSLSPSLSDEPPPSVRPKSVLANPAPFELLSVAQKSWVERTRETIVPWLGHVIMGWLVGVLFCMIRPVAGLWTQWRFQHRGLSDVTEETQRLMQDLARRIGVTHVVRIAESTLVRVPMVVGYLRPIILLPVSVLVGMTPAQLESLLAHELAHIRRHDWIVNAIQVVVETLLFYHPAVWWLSHRIRCERELCCDDLALGIIGDRLTYGRMLLALEQLRYPAPSAALAVNGGELVQRIHRLLPARVPAHQQGRGWLAGTLALGALAILFVGWLATSPSDAEPPSAAIELNQSPQTPPDPVPQKTGGKAQADTSSVEKLIVRGQVVMPDGALLPKDVKLQKRITGSNFSEWPKDVALNDIGEFAFEIPHDAAFVRLYVTSSETAPASTSRFEVKRGQVVQPIAIKLSRGYAARLRLRTDDGTAPAAGSATVTLRNSFEPQLGVFPVAPDGEVTIAHCPEEPVQVDLLMPGFEEQRIHRLLSRDKLNDVVIRSTPPARFRLVDSNGQPIVGALVRRFSRVRADSFLTPQTQWGEGPVWATSDADGRVELTTLCVTDPVPTTMPGPADYAFRIDAPGLAPYYVGSVRAGSDLGQILLSEALQVDGEILRDATQPERVSVQWRQPTIRQGGASGKGEWQSAKLSEADGRLTLQLTGLRSGPFDLFIVYYDPKVPADNIGGTLRQLEFHGILMASSTGLKISRETITPGDANLKATRGSLFPIDEMPPSNLPKHVVSQLIAEPKIVQGDDGKATIPPSEPTRLKTLLIWSHTAPVQHSMGHVGWHLFVLQDGTVIVPGARGNNEAGALHKLTAEELQELKAVLDKHPNFWGRQVPEQPPEQAGWKYGHEKLEYQRDGKTKSFLEWDGNQVDRVSDLHTQKKEITDYLSRVILEAKCGGRAALKRYRDIAGQALLATVPQALALTESDWCSAMVLTDGTREIDFSNVADNSRVNLIHPLGGQPYVDYIEFGRQRMAAAVPKDPVDPVHPKGEGANTKQKPSWSAFGRVVDAAGKPVSGAMVWASTGLGSLRMTGSVETDADGKFELTFLPGLLMGKDDEVQLQVATISVRKAGFFEKSLSRQGDLLMARKLPEKLDWDKRKLQDIILPDQPRQIDFVLLPAAKLSGILIERGKPVSGYSVSLTGDQLPPSSSVVGSTKTDESGQFKLTEIPTGFKFQLLVEPAKPEPPWNAWASGPFEFKAGTDAFFIQEPDREVEANRFELQIKGPGVNWRRALQIGEKYQKLEPIGDWLTTKGRMHAATIRLELAPEEAVPAPKAEVKGSAAKGKQPTETPTVSRLDGRQPTPDLIKVELKLDRVEYLLGESVIVDYVAKNIGKIPAPYDEGGFYPTLRLNDGFVMSASKIDDQGQPTGDPVVKWPMPTYTGGPISNFVLEPNETISTTLPVTRYLRFLEPGRYRLKIENVDRHSGGFGEQFAVYSAGETILTLKQPTAEEARGVFAAMKRAPRQAYDDGPMTFLRNAADFQAMHQPVYLPILRDHVLAGDQDAQQALERMQQADANAVLIEAISRSLDQDNWQSALGCFQLLKPSLPLPNWYREPLEPSYQRDRDRVTKGWKAEFVPVVVRLAQRLNAEVASQLKQRQQQSPNPDATDPEFQDLLQRGLFPVHHPQALLKDIDYIYRCVGQPADFADCLLAYSQSIELTRTLPLETHQ